MGRLIAIGDVHGCVEELTGLVEQIDPGTEDRVVFLGDLIDRGPDSVGAVRLARATIERIPDSLSILGSHEAKLARIYAGSGQEGLPDHLQGLTDEELGWLASLPLFARDRERRIVFVHGGFYPDYFARYGALPEHPDDLAGQPRKQRERARRFVFVRRIDDRGRFVGLHEETADARHWADLYDGREGYACFGHEPFLDAPRWSEHAVGIDGGCVFGGELLAAVWADGSTVRPTILRQRALQQYAVRRSSD